MPFLGGKHKPLQTDAVSAASLLVAEVAWNPIRKSVLHDCERVCDHVLSKFKFVWNAVTSLTNGVGSGAPSAPFCRFFFHLAREGFSSSCSFRNSDPLEHA